MSIPPIGTYWTNGILRTVGYAEDETYSACARCGAFVNVPDRHDEWHLAVEGPGAA